jgi:hypothetical protein
MAEAVVKKIFPERAEAPEKTKPSGPASWGDDIDKLKRKLPASPRDRMR